MTTIEFYDVKLRKKVAIEIAKVSRTTFTTPNGQTRYGVKAVTEDGRNLTKFVSKVDWDKIPE